MDTNALVTMLEAYGADPNRWPADRRPAAEALIAARHRLPPDERARVGAALAEAGTVDGLLRLAPAEAPSAALAARILAAAPGSRTRDARRSFRRWSGWLPHGAVWRPAVPLLAAVAIGFWLGGSLPASIADAIAQPLTGADAEAWESLDIETLALGFVDEAEIGTTP